MEVFGYFPINVMVDKIRLLTKEERNFIDSLEKTKNTGNWNSVDSYILDNPIMSDFKKEVEQRFNTYLNAIQHLEEPNSTLRLTQSWANWTNTGEYHHPHTHPNSYLSGVYYVQTEKGDGISFRNPNYREMIPYMLDTTADFDSANQAVETGQLIIFPSNLHHKVFTREDLSDEPRISIAMNSFPTGVFGHKSKLTEVIL